MMHSDQDIFAQQWDAQHGPLLADALPLELIEFGIGQHVRHVDGAPFEDDASGDRTAVHSAPGGPRDT